MAATHAGVAFVKDRYVSLADATIPIVDWGYRRSDVTYDVVTVWKGSFFQLEAHLSRFRRSMNALRMDPGKSDAEIREILMECVSRSGFRDAYVAMDCLRGLPAAGQRAHPAFCENYLVAHVRPYVSIFSEEVQQRGAHLIIASVPRIPSDSVDPTIKNFHWGDLTRGNFEAFDAGADGCVLLDHAGHVTEGPGYNIFSVRGGKVVTPDSGALEGITRSSIIELCAEVGVPCEVRPLPAAEFLKSDEVFATSSAGGVMPVSRVGTVILSDGRPGPITTQLRKRYWEKRESGWHATPVSYRTPAAQDFMVG